MVAIGGETTGTTITFNRIIWELQLHDDVARDFAKTHHKKPVVVTGALRKVAGIETKVHWIIDVKTFAESDSTKDKEGARLTIQGTLQTTEPRQDDSASMTVSTGHHAWPVDLTTDVSLQPKADALIGQWVVLTGSLEQVVKKEPDTPQVIVRVKTLKRSAKSPPLLRVFDNCRQFEHE